MRAYASFLAAAAGGMALLAAGCADKAADVRPVSARHCPDPSALFGDVAIEGGVVQLGSDRFYPEERPIRTVEIAPFVIDATEVTNAQFAAFVEAENYVTRAERGLPEEAYDVVVLGATVFVRIEAAHPETRDLIAALRLQYPRSVLLLCDGYVGGQHYMDYDADDVLAQYPELDAILKYPGERFLADPEYLTTLRGARRVLRDPGERGGDPHEAFYYLDGIDMR